VNSFWPLLVLAASGLQVARNAAQRDLTAKVGLWGATYVRFLFGFPFAVMWVVGIVLWRGPSGAPNWEFVLWILVGASTQAAATAGVVFAMRGRAFAVATAFTKTEAAGTALVGTALIHDVVTAGDWLGIALGTAGIVSMARVSATREAFQAALAGIGAGLLFSFSSVAYRAAAQDWGGDPWVGAAATLISTLLVQTLCGGLLMVRFALPSLRLMIGEWRACLVPGAAGAFSSALLFTSFAIGPSAGAVKALQLVDVIIAWGVSRRFYMETIRMGEAIGIALILVGAIVLVL
jgi:drug/metabolite transporter (DMT)-like permease